MLGLILPDAIYAVFEGIAKAMPPAVGRVLLGILVGGWLVLLTLVLRVIALRVDVVLALSARRRAEAPGPAVHTIGYVGVWLPRIAFLIAASLVIAQFLVSLRLAGYLVNPEGAGRIAALAGRLSSGSCHRESAVKGGKNRSCYESVFPVSV
jgi:hypothetical protein